MYKELADIHLENTPLPKFNGSLQEGLTFYYISLNLTSNRNAEVMEVKTLPDNMSCSPFSTNKSVIVWKKRLNTPMIMTFWLIAG